MCHFVQGLLFMPCFFDGAGALLVMNPLTAKSCIVNKFLFPSTVNSASTMCVGFQFLLFIFIVSSANFIAVDLCFVLLACYDF